LNPANSSVDAQTSIPHLCVRPPLAAIQSEFHIANQSQKARMLGLSQRETILMT